MGYQGSLRSRHRIRQYRCRSMSLQAPDGQVLYTTAQVTLVAVDREKGKILRRLPATVETALTRLAGKAF